MVERHVSEAFERDGFVALPGLLSDGDLAQAVDALPLEFPTIGDRQPH